MSGPAAAKPKTPRRVARSSPKTPATSKRAAPSKKSRQKRNQKPSDQTALICPVDGCGRSYKTKVGFDRHTVAKHPPAVHVAPLVETTAAAVERALTRIEDSPKRAVLVATIRRLADALDEAEPTDRPKISKELATRMAELNAEANPGDDDDDWTTGSGPSEVRNP